MVLVFHPSFYFIAFNVSALILLVISTDAVLAYPRSRISLNLSTPESAFIGDAIEAVLQIVTGKRRRPARFEVALELEGDAQPEMDSNPFIVRGSAGLETARITTRRRGVANVNAVWLRWQGPLGLVEQTLRFPMGRTIRVLPNVRAAHMAALAFFARDALFGMKMQIEKGDGSEFDALREYAAGMDIRGIDWKQSARHRKLLTKEFRAEKNHPVILAFDTGRLMREPLAGLPRLDHAINAGLLTAWMALRGGDLVGECAFDSRTRQYLMPTRGIRAFRHLQQSSASLAYSEEETNFTIGISDLHMRLARRSLVILFTEFVDTVTAELLLDNIKRMARRHLVVFVTLRDTLADGMLDRSPKDMEQIAAAVLAQDFQRDRSVVLERLHRMGIHCLDVTPSRLSPALINKYLTIKQRGLL
jgi:uncharacterized protein (DUF58 family)